MMVLELVFLTLGAFLRTVHNMITTRSQSGCIHQARGWRGTLVPLIKLILTFQGEYEIVRLLRWLKVDWVQDFLGLAQS